MAAKKQQTHAKRARELAVKERRERKQAKKAEVAAQRAAGTWPAENGGVSQVDNLAETGTVPEEGR